MLNSTDTVIFVYVGIMCKLSLMISGSLKQIQIKYFKILDITFLHWIICIHYLNNFCIHYLSNYQCFFSFMT